MMIPFILNNAIDKTLMLWLTMPYTVHVFYIRAPAKNRSMAIYLPKHFGYVIEIAITVSTYIGIFGHMQKAAWPL